MRPLRALIRNDSGAAAAEMVLVTPMLIILMLGSVELGSYFLTEHAVTKQVRDGARYASRLTLADDYECSTSDLTKVFKDADAEAHIINVTKVGAVTGDGSPRFADGFWAACGAAAPVTVSIRCIPKTGYGGIYAGLSGDIPVVSVRANVAYPSLFGTLGFDTSSLCISPQSEGVVAGL